MSQKTKSTLKLFPFQREILKETASLNRVAYYLDMGLGKTFVGGQKLKMLNENINLVICQKSKINDWLEHFEQYYSFKLYDLTKPKKYEEFLKIINDKADVKIIGVINYDLCWRRKQIKNIKNFTLLLDESSLIQNETAKRTRFITKLNYKNLILLSGTPTAGKYERLYSQIKMLGWKITKTAFWERYINYSYLTGMPFPVKVVEGYKNIPELIQNLKSVGAIFLKTSDVLEMPEQKFINVPVKKDTYLKEFEKNGFCIKFGKTYESLNSLTAMLRERELCNSQHKIAVLRDMLESTENRIIIFYNFEDELTDILTMLNNMDKEHISIVNGAVKDLSDYLLYDDSVTLVQYQAGAMGLNLQSANIIIYYSPPLSCDLYMQSEKRIHRIGQEQKCIYYKLVTVNSVEQSIYKALERGEDYTNNLFSEFKRLRGKK